MVEVYLDRVLAKGRYYPTALREVVPPSQEREPFRKQNVLLTQRDDNPTVLLHDIFSIKVCLRGIQAPPLLLGEAQGHILDGYQSLKQAQRLSVSSCSDGKYDLTTKG